MTVTVYKSTDASAPSLTGQVGTLVSLLDAILVNGYGSKPAQGWSKVYTGTNKAAFRQPVSGANGRYLRVDDSGSGSAAYARVVGYESMSDVDTGTAAFPTAAQFSGGLYAHKSSTADSTARPWFAYGNGRLLYLFVATDSGANSPIMGGLIFGDITTYVLNDQAHTTLMAQTTTSAAVSTSNNWWLMLSQSYAGPTLVGCYMSRGGSNIGGSSTIYKVTNSGFSGQYNFSNSQPMPPGYSVTTSGGVGASMPPYPNPADSALYMDKIWIADNSIGGYRGEMPGMWAPMHQIPINHLDTFAGSGAASGKTFEAIRFAAGSTQGELFMETSDTW